MAIFGAKAESEAESGDNPRLDRILAMHAVSGG